MTPPPSSPRQAPAAGPGVPLSVWPGPSGPAAAAGRVIGAFSRPGDLIAAAGGCPAVTRAAAVSGRAALGLPGGGAALVAGQAALALAGCDCPGCCAGPGDESRGGLLYAACERVLRPAGVLAVIAGPENDDPPGATVAAARAAGLAYAQHIVLLLTAIDGDRLGPSDGAAQPGTVTAHRDLLIFTKPGGPRL